METATRIPCANCQRLRVQVNAQQAEIGQLQEQLAAARKDSLTSPKPPSSDIVKPKPAQDAGDANRSIGGHSGMPAGQGNLTVNSEWKISSGSTLCFNRCNRA